MDDERRVAKRHGLWIPIQLTSGPDIRMLAVSQNISWSGALVVAGADLEIGSRVSLTLQVPGEDERQLGGEIVRVEVNEEDPDGLWRFRLAIQFDESVPELEPAFERLGGKSPLA